MAAIADRRIQFAPVVNDYGENGGYELRTFASNATNLSERIAEEVFNGVYECPICADKIEVGSPVWACRQCYHVYHLASCIEPWANTNTVWNWTCPTCKANGWTAPVATCWCGRKQHAFLDNIENTCGTTCNSTVNCDSPDIKCYTVCEKPCHPGPCDPPICTSLCISANKLRNISAATSDIPVDGLARTAMVMDGMVSRPPAAVLAASSLSVDLDQAIHVRAAPNPRHNRNCWEGFCSRWDDLEDGSVSKAIWWLLVQTISQCFIALWGLSYSSYWMRPLEHRHFTERWQFLAYGLYLTLILLIIMPIICLLQIAFVEAWEAIIIRLFNIQPKTLRAGFVCLLLLAIIIGAVFSAPIWFFAGPTTGWYYQMRNSCEGFDTRVKLDRGKIGILHDFYVPASSITLYNPSKPRDTFARLGGMDHFDISSSTENKTDPAEPFFSYHRMAGMLFPGDHLAVDFDLQHHIWRIMRINDNITISQNQTSSEGMPATGIAETLLRNGTWNQMSKFQPHLNFPSLKLQIPSMYYFTQNCQYMPFMTVFRTQHMDAEAVAKQSKQNWKTRSDDNVVMRTTSFGHRINGLEVCAKRDDYLVKGKNGQEMETRKGLGEDIVVPLGLMAVLNNQMASKKYDCSTLQ